MSETNPEITEDYVVVQKEQNIFGISYDSSKDELSLRGITVLLYIVCIIISIILGFKLLSDKIFCLFNVNIEGYTFC